MVRQLLVVSLLAVAGALETDCSGSDPEAEGDVGGGFSGLGGASDGSAFAGSTSGAWAGGSARGGGREGIGVDGSGGDGSGASEGSGAPEGSSGSAGSGGAAGAAGSAGGMTNPIEHVIVFIRENHTFDNYFGSFPGAEGIAKIPLKSGGTMTPPHAADSTPDLCHSHSCAFTDWASGKLTGWEGNGDDTKAKEKLAWAQYHESDIPNYWQYARHFTLADHFFSEMLGPSQPGHLMYYAAQAAWADANGSGTTTALPRSGCDGASTNEIEVLAGGTCALKKIRPCFKIPSVPEELQKKGVSWKAYGSNNGIDPEVNSVLDMIHGVRNDPMSWANIVPIARLASDIKAHTLPSVAWYTDGGQSEHPGTGSICEGEKSTVTQINLIMQSDYWKSTAIFIAYDDFGGWYDHVAPPRQYGCGGAHPYGMGFRLPLTIISPYAKPGFVFKEVSEQASIPRFIERLYDLPTMASMDPAAQDANANDLFGAFDFTQAPLPPLVLEPRACP